MFLFSFHFQHISIQLLSALSDGLLHKEKSNNYICKCADGMEKRRGELGGWGGGGC